MGSEGERRAADCSVVRDHSPRALGRIHRATRFNDHGHFRQRDHELLMVWSEHVGDWPSFLRFHAKSISMAGWIYAQPARVDGNCRNSTKILAQFPNIRRFASSNWRTRRIRVYTSKIGSRNDFKVSHSPTE